MKIQPGWGNLSRLWLYSAVLLPKENKPRSKLREDQKGGTYVIVEFHHILDPHVIPLWTQAL